MSPTNAGSSLLLTATASKLERKLLGFYKKKKKSFHTSFPSPLPHPGAGFLVSFRPNVPAKAWVFGVTVLAMGLKGFYERLYHRGFPGD